MTTEVKDVVARLRAWRDEPMDDFEDHFNRADTLMSEAADALEAAESERDEALAVRNFILTDHQRLLRREDVEGACGSINVCFEYSTVVRCGPCAIKRAALAGVATNHSLPNSPQEARLQRALAAAESRATAAEGRVALLEEQVEQAFRDGLAYATNVVLRRPEEHDIAWLTSQARARLAKGGQ